MHRPLSDALMWGVAIDDRTIVTKAGEFMTCLRYIPRDRASSTPAQCVAARAAINDFIRKFGRGWCLWFEDRCDETTAYETASFPDPVSREIDEQRRRFFTAPGTQLESVFVVTLLYAPPPDAIGRLEATLETVSKKEEDRRYRRELDTFRATVAAFKLTLSNLMPYCEFLHGDDLTTFLHNSISTQRQAIQFPPMPTFLSEYLTDDTFVSGCYPMLGTHHLRTIVVKDQPESMSPGMLFALGTVGFAYRHVARWAPLAREAAYAELEARRDSWADAREDMIRGAFRRFMRKPIDPDKMNLHAATNMEGCNAAIALLATGVSSFGRWTHTVTLMHPDLDTLQDRCQIVQRIFSGFPTHVAEDDATGAWIGTLPGHPRGGMDRFLGPSLTFAEIIPSTADWCGPVRDEHLDGPPLLHCMSEGGKAFRLCLHQEGTDVGHILVLGEMGAGKSTLLKSIVCAHRKYEGSRVFYIDRGAVAKLTTLALGGEFHALAAGDSAVSLQPLARLDEETEFSWAFEFVLGCLRQQGLEASAGQKRELTIALRAVASQPVHLRTLTSLQHATQDHEMRDALGVFCLGGACGDLLDNDRHQVGSGADVQCYETDRLLQNPMALAPVLACIFHEIARSHDDARPTLVVVDECKTFITRPLIAAEMDELVRRSRRENMQIVLATHSMLDVEESALAAIIASSFKQTIFTANTAALEPITADTLVRHGLTPTQVGIVAGLMPKREYAFRTVDSWRKFELVLSDYERAIVCGGSGAESKIIDRILAAGPREQFAERWLEHKGLGGRQWQQAAE